LNYYGRGGGLNVGILPKWQRAALYTFVALELLRQWIAHQKQRQSLQQSRNPKNPPPATNQNKNPNAAA